ncbi:MULTISPECIES: hypothetical protein [Aphanothece]|uniref:hypothetical protein n=1 Tax=Aphanothece TaxID=1121 RepID=UPI00398EFDCA
MAEASEERRVAQQVKQRLADLHSPLVNQWLQKARHGAYTPPNPFADSTLAARAVVLELVAKDEALGLALARAAGKEQEFGLAVEEHLQKREQQAAIAARHDNLRAKTEAMRKARLAHQNAMSRLHTHGRRDPFTGSWV